MKTLAILCALLMYSCAAGQKGAKLLAGVTTAYGIHETGHQVASMATDTPIDWDNMEYTISPKRRTDGAIICASGLTAQQLSSEVIIRGGWKNDFTNGMMLWNTINPIAYSLGYWLSYGINYETSDGGFHGDISGIEHYSNDTTANLFSAAMIGLSVLNAYRYWWADKEPVNVGLIPVSGGAGIFYSRRF
jgi:hypothetical protein